ncbi:MAG: hypothetical protein M9894_16295 [Planctomycetes bacterium]|nr:hypothetical protein [Planctomycetota bacterium]
MSVDVRQGNVRVLDYAGAWAYWGEECELLPLEQGGLVLVQVLDTSRPSTPKVGEVLETPLGRVFVRAGERAVLARTVALLHHGAPGRVDVRQGGVRVRDHAAALAYWGAGWCGRQRLRPGDLVLVRVADAVLDGQVLEVPLGRVFVRAAERGVLARTIAHVPDAIPEGAEGARCLCVHQRAGHAGADGLGRCVVHGCHCSAFRAARGRGEPGARAGGVPS